MWELRDLFQLFGSDAKSSHWLQPERDQTHMRLSSLTRLPHMDGSLVHSCTGAAAVGSTSQKPLLNLPLAARYPASLIFAHAAAGNQQDTKTSGSHFDFLTPGAAVGSQVQGAAYKRLECGVELALRVLSLFRTRGGVYILCCYPTVFLRTCKDSFLHLAQAKKH